MNHEDFLDGPDIEGPSAFIQWKGTNVCMDWYCPCGSHNHVDDYFAYHVECPECHERFEVGCYMRLRPTDVTPDERPFAPSSSGEISEGTEKVAP